MKTLYYARVERRDFGDLLSSDRFKQFAIRSTDEVSDLVRRSLRDNELAAVWSREPQRDYSLLPEVLICADGSIRDWAAWITTFGARIRPFSAVMRLMEQSEFSWVSASAREPALNALTWPAAGVILGEVLAASRLADKALETLPASACESTLSFALFRAAASYSEFGGSKHLVDAWDAVRRATGQRSRPLESTAVAQVCIAIIDAAGLQPAHEEFRPSPALRNACRQLIEFPEQAPAELRAFAAFASTEEKMRGSREDRVVAFTNFIRSVEPTDVPPDLMAFMLGYLASRIAPGTIQHVSVLSPVGARYATAVLWYGFCAGLGLGEERGPNQSRRTVDLPATARRVVRDLLRPNQIVSAPECDIALFELLALAQTGTNPLDGLITTTQGTATIELIPNVLTNVNVGSRSTAHETISKQSRDKALLSRVGEYIDRLADAYGDLIENEDPPYSEDGQRPLFSARKRRR